MRESASVPCPAKIFGDNVHADGNANPTRPTPTYTLYLAKKYIHDCNMKSQNIAFLSFLVLVCQ